MGINMRHSKRGFVLALVLGIGAVLLILSIGIVRFMAAHLFITNQMEKRAQAKAAATTAINSAVAQLYANDGWSAGFPSTNQTSTPASYLMNFVPAGTAPTNTLNYANTGFSTNNRDGTGPVTGYQGRIVPPGCVHLVSAGQSGGVQVLMQSMVTLQKRVLTDNFTTNTGAWTQSDGGVPVIALGQYLLDLTGILVPVSTTAGDPSWTDITFSASGIVTSGVGWGLIVRSQGTPQLPSGYLANYSALDNLLAGGTFHIYKMVNGNPGSPVASITRQDAGLGNVLNLTWLLGLAHTYSVTAQGNKISFSVDNIQVLKYRDAANSFQSGRVGMQALAGTLLIANWARVDTLFEQRAVWSSTI